MLLLLTLPRGAPAEEPPLRLLAGRGEEPVGIVIRPGRADAALPTPRPRPSQAMA